MKTLSNPLLLTVFAQVCIADRLDEGQMFWIVGLLLGVLASSVAMGQIVRLSRR